MKKSQLNAISYNYTKRANERRKAFILEKEGTMANFEKSKYKNMLYYILKNYGIRIY